MVAALVILCSVVTVGSLYMAMVARNTLIQAQHIRQEIQSFQGQLIRLVQDSVRNR